MGRGSGVIQGGSAVSNLMKSCGHPGWTLNIDAGWHSWSFPWEQATAFCVSQEKLKSLTTKKVKSGPGHLERTLSSYWAHGKITLPCPGTVSLGQNSCHVPRRQIWLFPAWSPKSLTWPPVVFPVSPIMLTFVGFPQPVANQPIKPTQRLIASGVRDPRT